MRIERVLVYSGDVINAVKINWTSVVPNPERSTLQSQNQAIENLRFLVNLGIAWRHSSDINRLGYQQSEYQIYGTLWKSQAHLPARQKSNTREAKQVSDAHVLQSR